VKGTAKAQSLFIKLPRKFSTEMEQDNMDKNEMKLEKKAQVGELLKKFKIDRNTFLTIGPIIILVIITLVLGLFTENFLTIRNGINVLEQASVLALLAMGATAVLIAGGIDLSMPASLSLGAVVGAIYMRDGGNQVLAAVIMVMVCILIGAVNGYAVAYLKMIPFVVTLAMQFVAVGAATALTGSISIANLPMTFIDAVQFRVLGVPIYSIIVIILTILFTSLLTRSFFGRWLLAVGTNPKAARVSGIPSNSVIFGAYLFAGLTAGLAAIISVGRLMSASALMAGDNLVLDVLASAVVGGVSIYGGAGSPLGAALGAFLITLISNSMNMMRVSYYLTLVLKGAVVVIFIWLNSLRKS
jgi:ribose transport system permease protein